MKTVTVEIKNDIALKSLQYLKKRAPMIGVQTEGTNYITAPQKDK